ncbi:hypothetical protein BYT27DRAFT_7206367 [Phlegmacium glaucopus]|nr:hypothetical protein BYT27DRAFT_7206367 [Phlegmacium glaucopus]
MLEHRERRDFGQLAETGKPSPIANREGLRRIRVAGDQGLKTEESLVLNISRVGVEQGLEWCSREVQIKVWARQPSRSVIWTDFDDSRIKGDIPSRTDIKWNY